MVAAAAAAAAAAAPMEMDELVEAFLLRLPPDDPASLVRASLVCKPWRRILADPGFRRRFCELHRRPPLLGLFPSKEATSRFRRTSSFRSRSDDYLCRSAIDSRHGRVLLAFPSLSEISLTELASMGTILPQISLTYLAVWDPISGHRRALPPPQHHHSTWNHWNATVLCASNLSSACDSIQCHHLGHFLVVLMSTSQHLVCVSVYSSQSRTWSETASAAQDPLDPKGLMPLERSALAGNALYFKFFTRQSGGILRYDLGRQEVTSINLPSNCRVNQILLTTTDYGGFGIARVESSRLHSWSRVAGPGGHLGWAPSRVIELNAVLPANTHSIRVVTFLHGLCAFLVSTNDGVFSVDLESNSARKVCEGSCGMNVVPYISFCTPAPDVAP